MLFKLESVVFAKITMTRLDSNNRTAYLNMH